MRLFISSDHAGVEFKEKLLTELKKKKPSLIIEDFGTSGSESVHYPFFAKKVADQVAAGKGVGVLICGTGIGMSIAANKISGIRAAVVWNDESAKLAKEHNDANILCLGARLHTLEVAISAVISWLDAQFQGGRHQERLDLIHQWETHK